MAHDSIPKHEPLRDGTPLREQRIEPPRFVVGIGASAGGLDPLVRFFDSLPEATGMAFVLVQHLSPNFKSLMDELLARHTRLPNLVPGAAVDQPAWRMAAANLSSVASVWSLSSEAMEKTTRSMPASR